MDEEMTGMPLSKSLTRRSFLESTVTVSSLAMVSPGKVLNYSSERGRKGDHVVSGNMRAESSFIDLLQIPDSITVYEKFQQSGPVDAIRLIPRAEQWTNGGIVVASKPRKSSLGLTLTSPVKPIVLVHVRWKRTIPEKLKVLGDAWERSYGDLGWKTLIPERVLPWYFATFDGDVCHGYGVKTDARALCFWQIDSGGISLWLNITNGGDGVHLGERCLEMATVVSHCGEVGVDSTASVAALCKVMCGRNSRPMQPIYGANDWCYAYGLSTAETILRDTEFIVNLSPTGGCRPFSVIDGGWVDKTVAWPDMGKLANAIRLSTARPGIWIRPLEAPQNTPHGLLLPDARFGEKTERALALAYDVTVPEAAEGIRAKLREVTAWGYEMVKHDFSTYDLFGQWGFEMGPQPTLPGWSLHDRSITNAEAIRKLYSLLREEAGETVLLNGCNTIGHLGQGLFDLQRTGDDTSGRQWERTRRMGVNTLAFRLPQHGSFYTLDADLVGITDEVPWALNRQWLDVLARSGTATMVSAGPPARSPEQQAALRDAFHLAAAGGVAARPLDCMRTSAPEHWQNATGGQKHYDWNGLEGTMPFLAS